MRMVMGGGAQQREAERTRISGVSVVGGFVTLAVSFGSLEFPMPFNK